jgi:DNA-binding PadR family transcriptional regulator
VDDVALAYITNRLWTCPGFRCPRFSGVVAPPSESRPLDHLRYYVIRYIIIQTMARKPNAGPASDLESFSQNKLGPGTLYTAITRLVEKRWIQPEAADNRQRPYRITGAGALYLEGQLEKMRAIASVGLRRLRFS